VKLLLLDLFSGIGGFSLGLERTGGFKTVAFCEIEPYPRQVLAKHWEGVPIYEDVRTLSAARLAADGIEVNAICGGFPCQDISLAGKGAGLAGERSGLWREYARLIGEIRPTYAIMENVAALLVRGMGEVLSDISSFGYDAEWHCIPASAIGAPHRRDRIWLIAYPMRKGLERHGGGKHIPPKVTESWSNSYDVSDANSERELQPSRLFRTLRRRIGNSCEETRGWWSFEPDVGRVADGVPRRVDRLKGLGNAVVPQIPEMIGNAILEYEGFT